MYLDVLGKSILFFHGAKAAHEMLERRASNSSGRPRLIVAFDILAGGLGLALVDHGDL